MPADIEPVDPTPDPNAGDGEPTDRDERRVKAFQHLLKGAIADRDLDGTGVSRNSTRHYGASPWTASVVSRSMGSQGKGSEGESTDA